MERAIRFVANVVRWFDKVNGNTYHSVNITRCADGAVIACPIQYGYGDQYRYTALVAMNEAGWLGAGFDTRDVFVFGRENNYPILWNVSDGRKRDCVANGKL